MRQAVQSALSILGIVENTFKNQIFELFLAIFRTLPYNKVFSLPAFSVMKFSPHSLSATYFLMSLVSVFHSMSSLKLLVLLKQCFVIFLY